MPADTRSRRISLSNSAKTATMPAIARPVGVVRSKASVSDTNATPSSSSLLQRQREVRERATPPIEPPHDHDVDVAASRSRHQLFTHRALPRPGLYLLQCMHDMPPAALRVLAELPKLHRNRLLVRGGYIRKVAAGIYSWLH